MVSPREPQEVEEPVEDMDGVDADVDEGLPSPEEEVEDNL